MKITYLITKSEIGGAQTHLLSLLKEAVKRGHDVSLISSPGGWLEDQCVDLNIKFIPNKFFKNSYNPFNLIKSVFLVRKILKKEKPDIIHCHSGGGGFYGRLAAFGLPIKKVFTAHGWSFRPGVPFFQKCISFVAEFLMKPLTDKVICVSSYDQKIGLKYGILNKEKSVVVHNGVDVPEAFSKEEKEKINIIFVGRLSKPKRQDIFLDSISILTKDLKEKITVNIFGSGENEELLRQKSSRFGLQSLVKFNTSLSHESMLGEYKNADILVLVSDYEAFPMVIIEAMSYGVPVVASSVGGIPEVVNNSNGILLQENTKERLKDALVSLIENKAERLSMNENARKTVLDNFTLDKMLSKTFAVYGELMSKDNLNSL